MSDRLKALVEKRDTIVQNMRNLIEKADEEKRQLNDDELAKHKELFGEQDKAKELIDAEKRQIEADRALADAQVELEETRAGLPDGGETHDVRRNLQMEGFRSWLVGGGGTPEARAAFRALSADGDPAGGYLVTPEQFVVQLIKAVDDMVFMRSMATTFTVSSAKSLGAPSLESDPDDAEWTSEIKTGGEDAAMAFGKRELTPHPLAKRIKVSKKLLRNAAMNPEQIVLQRLAYKFGITEEKAYLLGSGANQPLGVFVASADGIPTSRDVSTGAVADFTMDKIKSAKYQLKAQYWPNATWLLHRTGVEKVALLKDGNGQYLWQPSTQVGDPDRLLGIPITMSEHVPNTFTTGKYVGMLADFSWYWIADALDFSIQALRELYAESNQDGFIGRLESDGMPVLAEAFVRLKTD